MVRQVSWLPDHPTPGPSHTVNQVLQILIPSVQWRIPVSFPVTVAGAAPDSHRLPSSTRASSTREARVTVPSGLSKKVPHDGGPFSSFYWFSLPVIGWVGLPTKRDGIPWVWLGSTNCWIE
jgi:hypothetical protein